MQPELIHLVLREHHADCADSESLLGNLGSVLDLDAARFTPMGDDLAEVEIGYSMLVFQRGSDAIVCDISAVWRLVYRLHGTPMNPGDLTSCRGVADSWLAWRSWLEATMAWMGLTPVRLPPAPSPELIGVARSVFEAWRARGATISPP